MPQIEAELLSAATGVAKGSYSGWMQPQG